MKKRDELVLIGILILAIAVLLLSSGCKMNIEKFGKSKEAEKEPQPAAEQKPKKEKTADEYLMEMRKKVGIKTEEKKEEAKVEEKKAEEKIEQKAEPEKKIEQKKETPAVEAKNAQEAKIISETNETKPKEFYMGRFNFLEATDNVGGAVKDVRMKTGEVGYAKLASIGSPKKYKIRVREFYAAYEYPFYTDDSYHNSDKVNFWLNQTDDVVKVERMN